MTRERMLMILGGLVLLAPWSGLPLSVLSWVLPICALAIIGIAFTLQGRNRSAPPHAPAPHDYAPTPAAPYQQEPPKPRSSHIAFS